MALDGSSTNQALLDGQLELWHHTFSIVKAMAFKAVLDLGIADAIHHHGGSATLPQILTQVPHHPSKIPALRRLMRALATTGVFTSQASPGDGEEPVYALTPMSRLLVGPQSQAAFVTMALHPDVVSRLLDLGAWFQHEVPSGQEASGGKSKTVWDEDARDAAFRALFNDAMVSDSRLIMNIAIEECGEVFQGISSLVDVGGGLGAAAQALSVAFPDMKCSVLDLGHVIARAPSDTAVQYIAGNMFESIPPANAILFKWVLHDWSHEDCVKILKNCKNAIAQIDGGGKVIIIDIVVGAGPTNSKYREVHALSDLGMLLPNGMERDEHEWKKIFLEAGFSGYQIMPVLGARSIIEVYP